MGLASTSFFGQSGISSPLWAAAPRKHPHYSEMQIDLEATYPTEDPNLRLASSTAAPHDPGRVSAHVSRLSSELSPLWWGSRGLLPPLLPMLVGSGGMAGGRGGPPLRDIRGGVLELLFGRLFQAGGRFSPHCERYGSTGTRSSSRASPHPAMPLCTQARGFFFPGTEVA